MIGKSKADQKGYTLIELLLYISILGSLLAGVSLFFVTSTTARVKNQSVAEVDRQGTLAMEYITQTIRNSTSISSPAAGASASSLTLVVPTSSLSPTIFSVAGGGGTSVLGYNQDGGITDESDSNNMNATSFVASASGTVTTLNALVSAAVSASPNNKAQMAIYSGAANPTTLLANSASKTLMANSWNAFTISSVSVTAGQKYWLAYNTNGSSIFENNLRYHGVGTSQSMFTSLTFGSWPASWTGSAQSIEFSMYADVTTAGSSGELQVKEGVASVIPLMNDKVITTSLTFTNLSRSGTPGVVRVSFTVSRVNSNNRNEYDYQKTFTASAALR